MFLNFGYSQNDEFNISSINSIPIYKATEPIVLDGELQEATWKQAEIMGGFNQYTPIDSLSALAETEMRITYDNDNLYVSAKCSSSGSNFIVQSLRRDFGFGSIDNISFLFDTFGDKTNAYLFGMNPYGARREAWISNGGKTSDAFDSSWDNKWYGESKQYENYWICELAIPFKILRFKKGSTKFRFNAYRNDTQNNEISVWTDMPNQIVLMDMNFMADIIWEEPLANQSRNISVIPYVTAGATRDFEDVEESGTQSTFNAGLDAKISLSTNLNLDLTVNPDFSQVEVDRQVTNLDRFEIFFPERRQFFLENADLFGRFGNAGINPFFSRRIGVSTDTVTGNVIQNTVFGGARVSGKLSDNLRLGVMSIQTAAQQENDLPSFNFSVAALEQKVFDRSTIAAIFVNKNALNAEDFSDTNEEFDRVVGAEFRLRSEDNYWAGKTSFFKSFSTITTNDSYSSVNRLEYNRRRYRVELAASVVGDGYDAEVGFVPRKDVLIAQPLIELRFFPNNPKINRLNMTFEAQYFYSLGATEDDIIDGFGLEESSYSYRLNIRNANTSRFNFRANYRDLILLDDFDPTRIQEDDIFLTTGSDFQNYEFELSYNSDSRKVFFYRSGFLAGKFFGGTRYRASGRIGGRVIPYGSLSIDVNYNYIDLVDPFETAHLWLVSPRLDITFSRKHFWTTFLQYNRQLENVSLNTRYQWRFAPASDFFLVYSENYITDGVILDGSRNRGIVAKLTYWLNL